MQNFKIAGYKVVVEGYLMKHSYVDFQYQTEDQRCSLYIDVVQKIQMHSLVLSTY